MRITRHFTRHAEGSVLVEFGDTRVLCTASVEETRAAVPAQHRPRLGHRRVRHAAARDAHAQRREAATGKQGGRTLEIQRLIGRALRAVVDLKALGERTITIDCDVLQADGGTRTASITGGYVALVDAVNTLVRKGALRESPIHGQVAAVSVGICRACRCSISTTPRTRTPRPT